MGGTFILCDGCGLAVSASGIAFLCVGATCTLKGICLAGGFNTLLTATDFSGLRAGLLYTRVSHFFGTQVTVNCCNANVTFECSANVNILLYKLELVE